MSVGSMPVGVNNTPLKYTKILKYLIFFFFNSTPGIVEFLSRDDF